VGQEESFDEQQAPRRPLSDRWLLFLISIAASLPFLPMLLQRRVPVFRDHLDYFVPLHWFTTQALRNGVIPFWNPFNGSGEPWLANPQTAVFYPPALLFTILPFATAYVLFVASHLALLGCGMYLLARRWCAPSAAALTAMTAMFCGPTLSLIDINNNLRTLAWLPFVVAAAVARRRGSISMAVPSLLLALSFLAGEPYLATAGALLYLLIRGWRRPRAVVEVLLTGTLAAALAAVQIIPFLMMLPGSDRAGGLDPRDAFAQSLHPADLLRTVVNPAGFGGVSPLLPLSQQFIPTIYLGALTIALAIAAVAAARRSTHRQVIVTATIIAAATVLLGSLAFFPGASDLAAVVQLNIARYPARHLPLAALAVALLAGLGLERAGELSARRRILLAAIPVVSSAVALTLLPRDASFIPRATSSFLAAVAAALVVGFAPILVRRPTATLLVAFAIGAELLLGSWALFDSRPFSSLFENRYAERMRRDRKVVRVIDEVDAWSTTTDAERRSFLGGYTNLLHGQMDVSTPAPVIDRRYQRFHDEAVSSARVELLDLVSTGYLVTTRRIEDREFFPLDAFGRTALYQRPNGLPIASLWTAVRFTGSDDEALSQTLAARSVTPLIVSGSGAPIPVREEAPSTVGLRLSPSLNEMTVEATPSVESLLLLTQTDANGWHLTVDGAPTEKLRVAGLFRAVRLPAGPHRVTWRYRPPFFTLGIALSLLALATTVAELVRFAKRRNA
jgi:hypothetical protein